MLAEDTKEIVRIQEVPPFLLKLRHIDFTVWFFFGRCGQFTRYAQFLLSLKFVLVNQCAVCFCLTFFGQVYFVDGRTPFVKKLQAQTFVFVHGKDMLPMTHEQAQIYIRIDDQAHMSVE